jgi:hypothetical protein
MKNFKRMMILMIVFITIIVSSCTKTIDKELNKKDFEEIKINVNNNNEYSSMKKRYIIDNLEFCLGVVELSKIGKKMGLDVSKIPTFREQISKLEFEYDSIKTEKLKIKENNNKLETFIVLKDVNTISIDKYNGYLSMTLDFNNQFEKEILYIIIEYKYVDKYDSEFFSEKVKITDENTKNFKGEFKAMTNEKYNKVSDFMYSKVPISASKLLQDEMGVEEANKKTKSEFLMSGFKISTIGIVFKDKSELVYQKSNWEYLEN